MRPNHCRTIHPNGVMKSHFPYRITMGFGALNNRLIRAEYPDKHKHVNASLNANYQTIVRRTAISAAHFHFMRFFLASLASRYTSHSMALSNQEKNQRPRNVASKMRADVLYVAMISRRNPHGPRLSHFSSILVYIQLISFHAMKKSARMFVLAMAAFVRPFFRITYLLPTYLMIFHRFDGARGYGACAACDVYSTMNAPWMN